MGRPHSLRLFVGKRLMPFSPPSLCTKGCGTLVYGGGQCPECLAETRRDNDRLRPNGYQRGYTHAWAKYSKDYLARHPYCECDDCMKTPFNRPRATDVDHTDGHSRTCPHAMDDAHVQALSHSHHAIKTAREDGGFGTTKTQRCGEI